MRRWLVLGFATFFIGCGNVKQDNRALIPLTRLPAPVRSTAYFKVVGVRYHSAWVTPEGIYQLRGKDVEGITRDVELSSDGTLIRVR